MASTFFFSAVLSTTLLFSYNLPDTALDPLYNWGPLSFYSDSAKDRLYKLPWDSGKTVYLDDGAYNRPSSHHHGYEYDFILPWGHPVLAARAGYVHFIGKYGTSTANCIQLIHLDRDTSGYFTTVDYYLHVQIDSPIVKIGQKIEQGQVFCYVGEVGMFDHLHFEVQMMGHSGIGLRNGQPIAIGNVPAPFVEVTQWRDGIPWRYTYLKSQNKRFAPVDVESPPFPNEASVFKCLPNPFGSQTTLQGIFPDGTAAGGIHLDFYDVQGRQIENIEATVSELRRGLVWAPRTKTSSVCLLKTRIGYKDYAVKLFRR